MVREKVREKKKIFKVRELSGNFVISQGILELSINSWKSSKTA